MINPETGEALVDFPTHFSFKVTGANSDDFEETIIALMTEVDPKLDHDRIKRNLSKTGKYLSLTIDVFVTEQGHIDKVYELLKDEKKVLFAI